MYTAQVRFVLTALIATFLIGLCVQHSSGVSQASTRRASDAPPLAAVLPPPQFENVAGPAGLDCRLDNSMTWERHQIEMMPGGVAVLDYNNDGLMDIYFTNGAESPSLRKTGPRFWNRLYRNNGNGTFTDVTEKAGLQGTGYTMAAAAGDFDNDGYTDLLVAGVGRIALYRNNHDGTFTDIAEKAGLNRPHPRYGNMWHIHATWVDYDRDGWLDLFIANYCVWDPKTEPFCGSNMKGLRAYCHPNHYAPLPNQLFHNNHDGTFTDVSDQSGIGAHLGKGMGAAVADYDGDGWPDIFVANDTEFNFLFHNLHNGKFEEVSMRQDVACNESGNVVAGMGADFRDIDNDGRPDIFVTDLPREGFLLFRNRGAYFENASEVSGLGRASLRYGGWSNAIVDLNNDGWKDLFSADSHALDNIDDLESGQVYRQPNAVFQQVAPMVFKDVSAGAGKDFQRAAAHRGSATADFDNDGKMDIVVSAIGERPELWHNVSDASAHWLLVRLIGRRSNRDGIGAQLKLETADGRTLWNEATTSVGFASSSDPRVHFGLGKSAAIKSLEITWPSGTRQVLTNVRPDQILTVSEPSSPN